MAERSGAFTIGARALQAMAKGAGATLGVTVLYSLLLTVVDTALYGAVMPGGRMPTQEDLLNVLLPVMGATLAVELLVGPLVAAMAVYIGRAFAEGSTPSLYQGINFALNRYGRMFLPHLAAQLSIQLGMVILIPGVLFQLQYAFVDAVAALEDEPAPLFRSKKLTRGRRKSIFLLFLPWLVLSQVLIFADLWAVGQSPLALLGVKAVIFLLYFFMQIAFYLLYDERTRKRRQQPA